MKLLLLLADGFEEIEALGTADLLHRAGIEVCLCSAMASTTVHGAHAIDVIAQTTLNEISPASFDGVILPGGMGGTGNLAANKDVTLLLQSYDAEKKLICAICAAPAIVLHPSGILRHRKVAGYPAEPLIQVLADNYLPETVHTEENLITAAGPGSFVAFAKAIITCVKHAETAQEVLRDALFN